VLTTVEIPVALFDAPLFAARLLHPVTLICVALAALMGIATLSLLWVRRFRLAQLAAGATVSATLAGFGLAMFPDLIVGQLSFFHAAAPRPTVVAYLTILPFGALILIPSLIFLYWTFRDDPLVSGE
jgi:cytochrome d ubiquinol oxidase subunit II